MIYVDDLTPCVHHVRWRHDRSCHLFTDGDVSELHAFARKIGLKRSWFQDGRLQHYDLTPNKRAQAIRAGAIECDRRKVVECMEVRE